MYLAAMEAIYPVNPNVLFFIEGTGQNGLANNWGDGVATDRSIISSYGIDDPNPFFTTLMSKPYLNQVTGRVGSHHGLVQLVSCASDLCYALLKAWLSSLFTLCARWGPDELVVMYLWVAL